MANYKDIAKIANVSIATVSHVINNTRFVTPETRKMVLDAMEKLKYRPNLYARGLAIGRTNTVGLVISDIRNPFYPELVQGTEEIAQKNNYNVFLCNTDYDIKKGLNTIGALISRKIDGIILASSQVDDSIVREVLDSNVNFVMVDWGSRNIRADSIAFDYMVGIEESLDYLITLGHRLIYFISGPKERKTSQIRINNFIESLKKYNNKNLKYKIIEGDHKLEGGCKAAKKILKEKDIPTAVMCSNDLTAIGAMQVFIENGLRIPKDISIIGLDNIKLSEILKPNLTTIELDRYKIGKTLMEFLLNRINNNDLPVQKVIFKTKLIKRESVSSNKNIN
ncbi:MAG: LacI family transcriptional regulator [Actinobacteria bacterium]|nr:LacI family transcriptional regulator [Actinomycetota bacterium]